MVTHQMLRILLSIHHTLNPDSGAPGITFALGQALRELGHSVGFLSFDQMPKLPPRLAALAFPAFAACSIQRRQSRLDVVDSSTGDTWIWARMLRRRGAGPLLVSRSHGLEHLFHEATAAHALGKGRQLTQRYRLYQGGYRLWEVAENLRLADLALFLNPTERDYAIERLGVAEARTRVLPNGIPDDFFDRAFRAAPPNPGEPAGMVQIGAWRELKGTEESVAAMTEVLARHPDETVSYLGTGVPAETVRELFPPALRERVEVVPAYHRDQLPTLLDGKSVQIFPTFSEGFGLGLLEGMACGLAPVASDVAGPSSLVADGSDGLLVPPGDPAAIVAAVERLLADRALLARLQAAARERAVEHTQSRVAEATEAMYREALLARSELVPT